MSRKQIFRILFLGALAIGGIILIQSYWVINSWYVVNSEFDERVSIALRRVAEKMAVQSESELPKEGLVQRLTSNSYVVNYNNFIDPHILEDFLIIEMDMLDRDIEFEYAVYDCFTEELVYGNCCSVNDEDRELVKTHITRLEDMTYFFIVRFPNRQSFLLGEIWIFVLLSLLSVMAVFAFLYAIRTIYRQKRLTELQKDFVNNMTHEFKTPLSSIRLSAMVLEGAQEIAGNERLVNYARIISSQSKRLSSQIENVLDIVRSEKKFVLKKETFDLVAFLKNAAEVETTRFNQQKLRIDQHYAVNNLPVLADKYHLSNVVSNIIENAVKYHKGLPGEPPENLRVELQLEKNTAGYRLSFNDEGIGIAPNYQKLIFNKFYRVPTGNVHNAKGFGLGLYYVRNICELHGWNITVESEPGKGSTFRIDIPFSSILE
jgi:two-component system phosphate regulon sensor histidine kinase PhoR